MGIGVDVDQYNTYPEVAPSLLTSAAKNMDVAAGQAVIDYSNGELEPGIQLATVANGGVGLAPYHDMDSAIPQECKQAVEAAREGLASGTIDTGYTP
jgi:basic membrane protein A